MRLLPGACIDAGSLMNTRRASDEIDGIVHGIHHDGEKMEMKRERKSSLREACSDIADRLKLSGRQGWMLKLCTLPVVLETSAGSTAHRENVFDIPNTEKTSAAPVAKPSDLFNNASRLPYAVLADYL
jgi:hypothetical protein